MRRFGLIVFLVIALSLVALTAVIAAPGATINSAGPFNPADCTIDVVFTVEDAGPYFVTLFDDGVLLAGAGGDFPAGSTQTVRFTVGGPDASPGVAFGVRESLAVPDAYDFVTDEYWTDPQGQACQDAGYTFGAVVLGAGGDPVSAACPIPLPSGAVQYQVPAGAPAFFAPNLQSQTTFSLPAGSWWVTQFEGDFAQVWIACQASMIWVPSNAVAQ